MSGGNQESGWKEKLAELKKIPQTSEGLASVGWTVPKRGDHLDLDAFPCGSNAALPESLMISNPNFVTPPSLSTEDVAALCNTSTRITPPELWVRTAKISNTLRVQVNDLFPFEVPLDLLENAGEKETVHLLQMAVYKALNLVLDAVQTLEQRHEEGTATPWPYRLKFCLTSIEREDQVLKFFKDRGAARADIGN